MYCTWKVQEEGSLLATRDAAEIDHLVTRLPRTYKDVSLCTRGPWSTRKCLCTGSIPGFLGSFLTTSLQGSNTQQFICTSQAWKSHSGKPFNTLHTEASSPLFVDLSFSQQMLYFRGPWKWGKVEFLINASTETVIYLNQNDKSKQSFLPWLCTLYPRTKCLILEFSFLYVQCLICIRYPFQTFVCWVFCLHFVQYMCNCALGGWKQ